jgi:ribosome-binding protein aMBF1 (putative translation factor)
MTKLKQARLARAWSQMDLAFRAEMAQSDISAIENGWRKPYPAQAKRLGKLLKLDPGELVDSVPDASAA